MNDNNNFTIYSDIPFYHNINLINFQFNDTINYNNQSHASYIYKYHNDNLIYTIAGFFKNNYLLIICDIYNNDLDVIIKEKNVIIIKLNWVLKNINNNFDEEEKNIYFIDNTYFYNLKNTAIVINNRKMIFESQSINIEDYLKIYKFKIYSIILSINNNINNNINNTKNSKIKKIKNYLSNLLPKNFI